MKLFQELLTLVESEDMYDVNKLLTTNIGIDTQLDGRASFSSKPKSHISFSLNSKLGDAEGQPVYGCADVEIFVEFGNFDLTSETYNTHGSSYPGPNGGIPEETGLVIDGFEISSAKANVTFTDFTDSDGNGFPEDFKQRHMEIVNKYVAKLTEVFSDRHKVDYLAHVSDIFDDIVHNEDLLRQAEEKERRSRY